MTAAIDVAIVGASHPVAGVLVELLEQRGFPVGSLYLLGDDTDNRVQFRGKYLPVTPAEDFDFRRAALVFAAGVVPPAVLDAAVVAGCPVIDCSDRHHRREPVPLVLPAACALAAPAGLQVLPCGAAIQLLGVLLPLQRLAAIRRVSVVGLQPAWVAGTAAIEELAAQTVALLNVKPVEAQAYPVQIAFNVIPRADAAIPDGIAAEQRLIDDVKQILASDAIQLEASLAWVPVFHGSTQAVTIEFAAPVGLADVRAALAASAGIEWADEPNGLVTPVTDATGHERVVAGGLRSLDPQTLRVALWSVADDVQLIATNAMQLAEILVKSDF